MASLPQISPFSRSSSLLPPPLPLMELEMVMLDALFLARLHSNTIESHIGSRGKAMGIVNPSSFASFSSSLTDALPSPSPLISYSSSSSLSSSSSFLPSSSSSNADACCPSSADAPELKKTMVVAPSGATERSSPESGMWGMNKMITPLIETEMVAREEKLRTSISSPHVT